MRSSAACTPRRARRAGRALLAALALAAAAPLPRAAAEPLTLGSLLERMASSSGVAARFREEKHLSLLEEPLETRGTLYFVPPDRFARFTTWPDFSALLVDGAALRYRDASAEDAVDLSGSPSARAFVENFVVLFGGDRERLERRYRPRFQARDGAWELALEPRRAPLSDVIDGITLRGDAGGLRELVMRDADGDVTRTRLEAVEVDRRFTAAELERVFSEGQPLPAHLPSSGP